MMAQAPTFGKHLADGPLMYNASAMRRASARRKAAAPAPPPRATAVKRGRVVSLLDPDLMLERAAKRFLVHPIDRCVKCHSTFIGHEPAFIHCYYCGKMARIANASLFLQEEFEMRSGMRAAS